MPIGDNDQWAVIAENDPTVNPSDLFFHPQQWGFVIFPAVTTPAGELALDSFRIVPEPASLIGAGIGLLSLLGLIRRRQLAPKVPYSKTGVRRAAAHPE